MIDFGAYGPLLTVSDLGLESSEAARLASVCDAIRGYVGWHIAPTAADDQLVLDNAFGRCTLLLPTKHLLSVAGAVDRDGADLDGIEWSAAGIVERADGWPRGLGAVTVTATHGFAKAPEAIVEVAADMVRDLYNAEAGPSIGNVRLDDAQVDFATPSTDVGVRRRIAYSYGHVLNRYKL